MYPGPKGTSRHSQLAHCDPPSSEECSRAFHPHPSHFLSFHPPTDVQSIATSTDYILRYILHLPRHGRPLFLPSFPCWSLPNHLVRSTASTHVTHVNLGSRITASIVCLGCITPGNRLSPPPLFSPTVNLLIPLFLILSLHQVTVAPINTAPSVQAWFPLSSLFPHPSISLSQRNSTRHTFRLSTAASLPSSRRPTSISFPESTAAVGSVPYRQFV